MATETRLIIPGFRSFSSSKEPFMKKDPPYKKTRLERTRIIRSLP